MVSATLDNDPDKATILDILGTQLLYWYKCTGNIDDLEASILRAEMAIPAIPKDYPHQAVMLNNLSNTLSTQYNQTRNILDLETAISRAEMAIFSTSENYLTQAS